jgi:hypothetical protein
MSNADLTALSWDDLAALVLQQAAMLEALRSKVERLTRGGLPAWLMVFETDTATVDQIRPRHRNEEVRERIPADYEAAQGTRAFEAWTSLLRTLTRTTPSLALLDAVVNLLRPT